MKDAVAFSYDCSLCCWERQADASTGSREDVLDKNLKRDARMVENGRGRTRYLSQPMNRVCSYGD